MTQAALAQHIIWQPVRLRFVDAGGVQTWMSAGHADPAAFLRALVADPDFLRHAAQYDWIAPIEAEVEHQTICFDQDNPETVYYLPDHEAERQQALAQGLRLSDPAPWTAFSREGEADSRRSIHTRLLEIWALRQLELIMLEAIAQGALPAGVAEAVNGVLADLAMIRPRDEA